MGVTLVTALEEATKQQLEKNGTKEEDKVFLALTPNGFEHVYQTTEFTVGELKAGSTRLEELMRKLAGKLNSNEEFHCVLQRSERQFDLIKQKYDKLTNPYKDQGPMCNGPKRTTETSVPEKVRLVDYESSDKEPLSHPICIGCLVDIVHVRKLRVVIRLLM